MSAGPIYVQNIWLMSTVGVLSSTASLGPCLDRAVDRYVQNGAQSKNEVQLAFRMAPRRKNAEQSAGVSFGVDDSAEELRQQYTAERDQGTKINSSNMGVWYSPRLYRESRYKYLLTLIYPHQGACCL
jgi:hypothetical protein